MLLIAFRVKRNEASFVRDVQQTRRSELHRLAAPKKFLLFRCWSFAIFLSNSMGNHVLVELHVSHVKAGSYRLMVHRTGFRANDAYSAFIEMGSPKDLTSTQLEQLRN